MEGATSTVAVNFHQFFKFFNKNFRRRDLHTIWIHSFRKRFFTVEWWRFLVYIQEENLLVQRFNTDNTEALIFIQFQGKFSWIEIKKIPNIVQFKNIFSPIHFLKYITFITLQSFYIKHSWNWKVIINIFEIK